MAYLAFARTNTRFLVFGFLLAALSSYGQTFLISLFGAVWREEFGLSNGEFGSLYSLATLISGVSLLWLGRIVDTLDLRRVTLAILLGAVLGALMVAAAVNPLMLGAAFLLLRLCGQGLLMHTAQTTMGRYFQADRGKAVSIATLGLPAAEAVMPGILVAVMALVGWRQTWFGLAAVLLLLVLPLVLFLLRGHDARRRDLAARENPAPGGGDDQAPARRHWRRSEVLVDPRFYGVLPAVLAPPFIMTALFFHQVPLAGLKGWSLGWLATSFVAFAGMHVVALGVVGPLVDRLGAARMLGGFLLPLSAGLALLGAFPGAWVAPLYLGLAGLSMGATGTLMGALWPELYGTRHLGAIRALVHACMVLSTAVAPALVGWVMDFGVSLLTVTWWLLGWTLLAPALAVVTLRGGPAGQPPDSDP